MASNIGKIPQASRFLLYSHDGLGLGHLRRNLSVASALAELAPRSSILVATSAEEAQRFAIPPNVDILRLPGLRKIDNARYTARRLNIPWRDLRRVRSTLLTAAVESFRPAVVLADKHPLGVGGELEPALAEVRTAGGGTALGFRDVLDDPGTVRAEWRAHGLQRRIAGYYDRVLVYGQPEILDPRREYGFTDEVAAMTRFCGYVVSPARARGRSSAQAETADRPHVLATAGGGEDGIELLSAFVEAAAHARWRADVVSGPDCDPVNASWLRTRASEAGVGFRRFVPDLSSEFPTLDALVCMGGYNTLTEAAASGVSTVCVPRVRPRSEQLVRAQAFARRGLLTLLEPSHLDPAVLGAEVESAVAREAPGRGAVRALNLGGARRAARYLLELAAADSGPRPDRRDDGGGDR